MDLSNSKPLLNDLNDEAARGESLVQELGDGFAVRAAANAVEEALEDNFDAMRNMVLAFVVASS